MKEYFRLDELSGYAYQEAIKEVIRAPFTVWTLKDLANPDYYAIEALCRVIGCFFDANGKMLVKEA